MHLMALDPWLPSNFASVYSQKDNQELPALAPDCVPAMVVTIGHSYGRAHSGSELQMTVCRA